jgi:hypothetical protein
MGGTQSGVQRALFAMIRAAVACVFACALPQSQAGETDRWQSLFTGVPPLPAVPSEALSKVAARPVEGRLRIEVSDAGLRVLQQDADRLYDSTARDSMAQVRRRLEEVNRDPEAARLSRRIDEVLGLGNPTGKAPSTEELLKLIAEVDRTLGRGATSSGDAPVPLSEIAAYRLELQRAVPRAAQFHQRLFDLQRRHAQLHAQADHDAIARLAGGDAVALAKELVERHQALAGQQLAEASSLLSELRFTLRSRFERMAQLARAAEARGAPAAERVQAYAVFKSYVEMLLTFQRETLQDAGFWAGVRPRAVPARASTGSGPALYEHVLAPDIDLQGNGVLPTAGPHYPAGRAFVLGAPPGIR